MNRIAPSLANALRSATLLNFVKAVAALSFLLLWDVPATPGPE
jgi:hypothetical protein